MTTDTKKNVGVIVGRFQVHRLTEGHKEIIDYVLSQGHRINILVLGNPPRDVHSTKNNPLPYLSRKQMIEEAYPGKFIICYKTDVRSDEEWSKGLDKLILSNTDGNKDVVLYGSRDSFINHYSGQFDCVEYQQRVTFSGSKLREELAKDIGTSEDFRKGCIYSTQKNWAFHFPTVDCAIFSDNTFSKLYLAKKEGEKLYRFPGGFIDSKDTSYEEAAIREAKEETNLDCVIKDYICSCKIADWRYRSEQEKIMTVLYAMIATNSSAKACDDIAELHLKDISELKMEDIDPIHQELFKNVLKFVQKETKTGWTDKSIL